MQNATRIQLAGTSHRIDAKRAVGAFVAMPGRVVVEMVPEPEQVGGLFLPPRVSANLRADVGVVISPAFATTVRGKTIASPRRGTKVCVAPYDGVWLERAEFSGYGTENQIRVYGHFCQHEGEPIASDWWDSVPCGIDDMGELQAYGDKVIVRQDPGEKKTAGGILLTDRSIDKGAMATVVSVGALIGEEELKPGDRVALDPRAIGDDRTFGFDLDEATKDLSILSYAGLLYRLPREGE